MARLTILGSGTPTPTPDRFGSSYVIQIGDQRLMFDCGPATTHKLAKAGLLPTAIDYLFFTHHHFDHDVDYPCFLLSRWDQSIGVESKLQVYGPTLTEQLTHRILDEKEGAYAHDWIARINHPMSQQAHVDRGGTLPRVPPSVSAKDVGPGVVCSTGEWRVTAATAAHAQPWLDSLAYRIECSEGTIVVTGDTRPCDSVTRLARGADVLVMMCWDLQSKMDGNPLGSAMSGTLDVARTAREAGARKLVLVHQCKDLAPHGPLEQAIGDITKHYGGQVIWGEEMLSIAWP
ncbi:MAG: MBL fold metallo-hydrolase [Chloroflexota bacterium]|nr:MBL fold metallo-hydrolase [Chloroflexota bacterium]